MWTVLVKGFILIQYFIVVKDLKGLNKTFSKKKSVVVFLLAVLCGVWSEAFKQRHILGE